MYTDTLRYTFRTHCHESSLKGVREFIKAHLEQLSITDRQKSEIVLAVDEVCSNTIIHGSNKNPAKKIEINLESLPTKIVIEIQDEGEFFDIRSYDSPSLDQLIVEKKKGNVGIFLVKKIMDHIECFTQNGVNYCRLEKSLVV